MKNYLMNISYNGAKYCGWAPQPGKKSITSEIKNSLNHYVFDQELVLNGSGRTDKGVHAVNQYATIKLDLGFSHDKLVKIMNKALPKDIYIKGIVVVEDDFHARFSAIGKTYKYIVETDPHNVFEKDLKWQVGQDLDIEQMREAAKFLIGEHDFTTYCSNTEGERETHVREITDITITQNDSEVIFLVSGKGFLRHMVRKIVGTLVKVGEAEIQAYEVDVMLSRKSQREGVYKAPGAGLYLQDVEYRR